MLAKIQNQQLPVEPLVALVENRGGSENTRRAYSLSVRQYVEWHRDNFDGPFSRLSVQAYKAFLIDQKLSAAKINQALTALRVLAEEAYFADLVDQRVSAGIGAVKGEAAEQRKFGRWLSLDEQRQLMKAKHRFANSELRNRIIVLLMLTCALRREEVSNLRWNDISYAGGRVVMSVKGKGRKMRHIPVPDWVAAVLETWREEVGHFEYVVIGVNRGGNFTGRMTPQSIYENIVRIGESVGIKVAPHDLRRTAARTMYEAMKQVNQVDLTEIQRILGHQSVQTTEIYLNLKVNLDSPANSLIPNLL